MRHLRTLRYIKEIVKAGSIRGAAESLTISPSALNRHIQTLELDLGFPIFERLRKGVRLSTEGELFFGYVQRQIASFDHLQSQIESVRGLRTGHVCIGISTDLGREHLYAQIAKYQERHADVTFAIRNVDQNDLELMIADHSIDMALFYQPNLSRELQVACAAEAPVHLVMAQNHPLWSDKPAKIYEVIDTRIILPPHGTELRNKIDAACERMDIKLRVSLECDNPLQALQSTGRMDIGFCLPMGLDSQRIAQMGLATRPVHERDLATNYVKVITSDQAQMTVAAERFVEQLRASFAD